MISFDYSGYFWLVIIGQLIRIERRIVDLSCFNAQEFQSFSLRYDKVPGTVNTPPTPLDRGEITAFPL